MDFLIFWSVPQFLESFYLRLKKKQNKTLSIYWALLVSNGQKKLKIKADILSMRSHRPRHPIMDKSRKKVLKTKLATGTLLSFIKAGMWKSKSLTTFHASNSTNCLAAQTICRNMLTCFVSVALWMVVLFSAETPPSLPPSFSRPPTPARTLTDKT